MKFWNENKSFSETTLHLSQLDLLEPTILASLTSLHETICEADPVQRLKERNSAWTAKVRWLRWQHCGFLFVFFFLKKILLTGFKQPKAKDIVIFIQP